MTAPDGVGPASTGPNDTTSGHIGASAAERERVTWWARWSRLTGVAEGWAAVPDGRFWAGTYRIRTAALLVLAAASAVAGGHAAAIAVLAVAVPFNLVASNRHLRLGRVPRWLCLDLVIAAAMSWLSPQVVIGSVLCIVLNSLAASIGTEPRLLRRYGATAACVLAAGAAARGSLAAIAFALPVYGSSVAVVRVSGYLVAKQRASASRLEDLLDGISAAVYEIDIGSGAVLFANQHSVELLGARPASAAELLAAMHPDDRAAARELGRIAMRESAPRAMDLRLVRGDEVRYLELRASVSDNSRHQRLRVVLVDVSDRKSVELELAHRALHDALTDLPNRVFIRQRMDDMTRLPPEPGRSHAVLLLDLDAFKDVNDGLGHHHGDLLLVEIAARLRRLSRPADTVARLGGDEFALWLDGADQQVAREVAERIRGAVSQPYVAEGVSITPEVSIGIACYPKDADSTADLLRLADMAMYRAKRSGTGYAVYHQEEDGSASDRLVLSAELRTAIAQGQLEPFFQPLVDTGTGRIVSCEALVRWRHPQRGLLTPPEFWPVVQSTGLTRDVARVMLTAVLDELERWVPTGFAVPVAVNLSASDLSDDALMTWFADELARRAVPAGLLTVELTEAELITQTKQTRKVLYELRSLGVHTSVDDFGTGYSSLVWLRDLPITAVKIDRSFVENLCGDDRTRAIVKSTIDLARDLDLSIVGEGVEDAETAEALGELGCERMQGYLFSRPVSAPAMASLLEHGLRGARVKPSASVA